MNQVENFIGIYPGFLSDHICDKLVSMFDLFDNTGLAKTRQQLENHPKRIKDDSSIFFSMEEYNIYNYPIVHQVLKSVWEAYNHYAATYDVLSDLREHSIYEVKLQKTNVGGGYHIWHCEQEGRQTSNRLLAYTIYLNDVAEGGETEFLYIPKRVPARKGTVCIFPAAFTHTHRGNPPISNTKYIATGWIEF